MGDTVSIATPSGHQSLKQEHLPIIEKRFEIVESIRYQVELTKGKNVTQLVAMLAGYYKISPSTYYRWLKAYDEHGLYGLRSKCFGVKRRRRLAG